MVFSRNVVGARLVFLAFLGGSNVGLADKVQTSGGNYSVSTPTQSVPSNYDSILTEESRVLSESGWEILYGVFELAVMALGVVGVIKYEEKSGIMIEKRRK